MAYIQESPRMDFENNLDVLFDEVSVVEPDVEKDNSDESNSFKEQLYSWLVKNRLCYACHY